MENLDDVDQEFGTRNKREAEELEPFEYIADYNGEFESSLRFKRDLAEQDPDDASIEDFEPRVRRDLKEEDDEIDEEAMEVRSKRESPLLVGDVLTMPGPKMQEWVENGTHRINQFTKLAYLLTNDIPAKIVYNLFQNATHRINLLNNEVHNIETTQYSSTSVVQMGYQIVKWFYAGMIKTDTFRDLKTPIMNAKYNSSIKYTAPNYTSLERNDTFFGYMNYKMPEWVFNGTHLVGSYSRLVHIINDPNSGLLVSNWFYNTSHQIDFVNDKVYAFAPSHYSPLNSAQQIVTWFIPSNGLIKQDTFKELEEPLADVNFNLSEIYFGSKNYTKIYKNESYARKREWSYDGTNLVNVNSRISYSVPSPVEAVLINNVFNNITHQTDFLMKKTYPVRNEMGGKFYQTISWYFNGLIRVDTLRNLQEPIIDPVFDLSTIYFEDPNSTYIYKNISKPPAIYMPPNLVPEWMFNGTHVNNLLKRIFYPIADPSAAEITSNWYYNATHKTDLLNRKSYSTDVKPSSTTPRVGYQVVNCRFKGVIRADTYKELYEPISEPTCNLKVIYNHPSKYTTFYADEKVSILPVKQPEWYFNGTHRINTFTNATYLVDNGKLQLPKEEWIFNGTHKVNLLTKESYPKEPERALPPVPEWIYNGTHKINTYTKKVYSMDPLPVQQPKDEWTFNGTHKVNLMTKEAYPTEPERSLPVQQEWIFNGTHKINTYTKKSYPVDSIASPPLPKDQWIYNGTHKVNLQTNEAYSSENQNSQPPKNEWVFNGTHKVNYATNIAYAVEPLPDAARPKTVDPLKDQWVASEKPAHSEEWIFNGTHKVNTKTNEAHVIPGYEKEREIVQPSLPPDFNEHPNVFTSNGTHKVNYHTKEAYPVEEVEVKPPQFVEDKREQEKTAHETKSAPEVQTPVGTKSFIPESPNKDLNSMHVKSPPMAPPSAPHPDKMPPRKDQLQNKDYVAPKLPETIKPVANKPPPAVPKIEATKTTKKPQQDIKVKLEPKFKCAGESFKVSFKTDLYDM